MCQAGLYQKLPASRLLPSSYHLLSTAHPDSVGTRTKRSLPSAYCFPPTPLKRRSGEGNDELDALHVLGLQVRVVGEEEVDSGGGSAGQLEGVRRAN